MPKIERIEYYSHTLGENVATEVTGHYGYPILMFPTSNGSFTQNHDFKLNESINWLVEEGKVKLYNVQTPDNDSFYNNRIHPADRIQNYERWIKFLITEYVPMIQKIHSTHRIAVAGASFGGYHASNFAFRFPGLVSHLFCLSGAFSVRNFMDGYQDELVYFNCPNEFVKNDEAWKYKHMHIVLSTSDQDICLGKTMEMSAILRAKGIGHWYDERKWIAHDWPLWRMVFPMFAGRYFG